MARRASRLQQEIRQSRPFRSPGQEAVLGLLRTADVVGRLFSQLLGPHGITLQQYNVLRILRGAGEEGLPTLSIRDRMIEQTPGITGLLDRLEAKGWVRRQRCREDRRQVLCRITPKGRRLLSRLDEPVQRLDDAAVEMLSPGEQRTLIRLLEKIRTHHDPAPGLSPGRKEMPAERGPGPARAH